MPRRARQPMPAGAPGTAPPDADHQAILESMPDVVYTLDFEGRLTYFNARAYEVFHYDRAEGGRFLGRAFLEILAPGASAAAMGAIRNRAETPDGSPRRAVAPSWRRTRSGSASRERAAARGRTTFDPYAARWIGSAPCAPALPTATSP